MCRYAEALHDVCCYQKFEAKDKSIAARPISTPRSQVLTIVRVVLPCTIAAEQAQRARALHDSVSYECLS